MHLHCMSQLTHRIHGNTVLIISANSQLINFFNKNVCCVSLLICEMLSLWVQLYVYAQVVRFPCDLSGLLFTSERVGDPVIKYLRYLTLLGRRSYQKGLTRS